MVKLGHGITIVDAKDLRHRVAEVDLAADFRLLGS